MDIYMSKRNLDSYLECQGCSKQLRLLSYSEKNAMADNPYNFVVFCSSCQKDGLHIENGFG